MWAVLREELSLDRGWRFALTFDSRPATFAEVIAGWRSDADFRTLFNSLLASAPFVAFRWETPNVTVAKLPQPFECVLLDDPGLHRPADSKSFAGHLSEASKVVTFLNLGRDAILVVPCPLTDLSAYCHLASFVRLAPPEQTDALRRAVGEAMACRVSDRPVWLSTAGAGVPWLHVRLDDRPKYYGHAAYRG